MSKHPLVTLARPVYKEIVAQAVASTVETGGIIMGRETRGRNCKVLQLCEMVSTRATKSWLCYTEDQRVGAVRAAEDRWPELLYLGEWHSHRYDMECILAHLPAISEHDADGMLVGKIEIIATVFPSEEKKRKNRWDALWSVEGDIHCEVEAWMRWKKKKIIPCRIAVR